MHPPAWLAALLVLLLVLAAAVVACLAVDARVSRRPWSNQLAYPFVYFGPLNALLHWGTPSAVQALLDASPVISPVPPMLFPHGLELQGAWHEVAQEALVAMADARTIEHDTFFQGLAPVKNAWTRFYIKWYTPAFDALALRRMPRTCALLARMPEVRAAMLSILYPGAYIPPHWGPFRGALRVHLCLEAPADGSAYIDVEGAARYSWKPGEMVLFDDTRLHSVRFAPESGAGAGAGASPRVVLFLDIERPLSAHVAWLNRAVMDTWGPLTHRHNEQNERNVNDVKT